MILQNWMFTGCWGFSDQRLRYKTSKPNRPNPVYVHPLILLLSLYWFPYKPEGFWWARGTPLKAKLPLELQGFALEIFAFFAVWQLSFVKQQNKMKCSEQGQSKTESTNGNVLGCLVLLLCISGRGLLLISFWADLHIFDLFCLYFRALSNSL